MILAFLFGAVVGSFLAVAAIMLSRSAADVSWFDIDEDEAERILRKRGI